VVPAGTVPIAGSMPVASAPSEVRQVRATGKCDAGDSKNPFAAPSKNNHGLSAAFAVLLNWLRPKQFE
jgi:hypothetical protein